MNANISTVSIIYKAKADTKLFGNMPVCSLCVCVYSCNLVAELTDSFITIQYTLIIMHLIIKQF